MTRVIFRTDINWNFKGEVTAVFPDIEATPGHMVCYSHVGQHSECSMDWYYRNTRPSKPEEYAELLSELQNIYNNDLKVYRKINHIQRSQFQPIIK